LLKVLTSRSDGGSPALVSATPGVQKAKPSVTEVKAIRFLEYVNQVPEGFELRPLASLNWLLFHGINMG
jgi:hypothetical protein